ncbi:MAG: Phosphoribosylglycinamide formyltransferase [Bacteroidota bacterium]|nr:MAG: Phosphoribosylglycinamide formyltransferase [Bacteroidota bacterium]
MKTIVVFASGSGTNAEKIISYFAEVENVAVSKIYTNNPKAGVISRAAALGVATRVFDRISFEEEVLLELHEQNPALIVLAGFLWKIPQKYIETFSNKIVNIHPALLPKYGGKGMYGGHVFQAIVDNNEQETGITIHYVNEHYDEGAIIFQAKTTLVPSDTVTEVAQKTHTLEHAHFAPQIHKLLQNG